MKIYDIDPSQWCCFLVIPINIYLFINKIFTGRPGILNRKVPSPEECFGDLYRCFRIFIVIISVGGSTWHLVGNRDAGHLAILGTDLNNKDLPYISHDSRMPRRTLTLIRSLSLLLSRIQLSFIYKYKACGVMAFGLNFLSVQFSCKED